MEIIQKPRFEELYNIDPQFGRDYFNTPSFGEVALNSMNEASANAVDFGHNAVHNLTNILMGRDTSNLDGVKATETNFLDSNGDGTVSPWEVVSSPLKSFGSGMRIIGANQNDSDGFMRDNFELGMARIDAFNKKKDYHKTLHKNDGMFGLAEVTGQLPHYIAPTARMGSMKHLNRAVAANASIGRKIRAGATDAVTNALKMSTADKFIAGAITGGDQQAIEDAAYGAMAIGGGGSVAVGLARSVSENLLNAGKHFELKKMVKNIKAGETAYREAGDDTAKAFYDEQSILNRRDLMKELEINGKDIRKIDEILYPELKAVRAEEKRRNAFDINVFLNTEGRAKNLRELENLAGGGSRPIYKHTVNPTDFGKDTKKHRGFAKPKVAKHEGEFKDKTHRQYIKETLLNAQGTTADKVMNVRLRTEDIKNPQKMFDEVIKSLDSEFDMRSRYNANEPVLNKGQGGSGTVAEKAMYSAKNKMNLANSIAKKLKDSGDEAGFNKWQTEAQTFRKEFEDLKLDKGYGSNLSKSAKGLNAKQSVDFAKTVRDEDYAQEVIARDSTISGAGNRAHGGKIIYRKEGSKYYEKDNDFVAKDLSDTLKKKNDKLNLKFANALQELSKRESLKGNDINAENVIAFAGKHPDLGDIIIPYIHRNMDISSLKYNPDSADSVILSEAKRINTRKSKAISGKTEEGLSKFLDTINSEFSDIGYNKSYKIDEVKKASRPKKKNLDREEKPIFPSWSEIKAMDYEESMAKLNKIKAAEDFIKTGNVARYSDHSKYGINTGSEVLSKKQQKDLKEYTPIYESLVNKFGAGSDEVKNFVSALVHKSDRNVDIAKSAKETIVNWNNKMRGQKSGLSTEGKSFKVTATQSKMDAKNNAGQNAAVLTGDDTIAEYAFAITGNPELRSEILSEMTKINPKYKEFDNLREETKRAFMLKMYGSGDKGLVDDLLDDPALTSFFKNNDAVQFVRDYNNAVGSKFPQLKKMSDAAYNLYDSLPNKTTELEFKIGDNVVKWSVEGKDSVKVADSQTSRNPMQVDTKNSAKSFLDRSILPRIVHGTEAYTVGRIREKFNIQTTHDSLTVPEHLKKDVDAEYRKIMKELASGQIMQDGKLITVPEGNIYEHILQQIHKNATGHYRDEGFGYKDKQISDKSIFDDKRREFIPNEVTKGEVLETKAKGDYTGKELDDYEFFKTHLARGDWRDSEHFNMIPKILDDAATNKNWNASRDYEGSTEFEKAFANVLNGKPIDIKHPDEFASDKKKELWDENVKKLEIEIRAQAEAHPNFSDRLKGERKYFDKDGFPIANTIKNRRQIRQAVENDAELYSKGNAYYSEMTFSEVKKKADSGQAKVDLNQYENVFQDEIDAMATKAKVQGRSIINEMKKVGKHLHDRYSASEAYKQYEKIRGYSKNADNSGAKHKEDSIRIIDSKYSEDEQSDYLNGVFKTDAKSIYSDIKTKAEADAFVEKYSALYNKLKETIIDSARGIGNRGAQIGYYLPNALAVAAKYSKDGIGADDIPIIDKLITIEAMNQNKAWKFYAANHGSEKMDYMINIAHSIQNRSDKQFVGSEMSQMKGYIAEVYDGGKAAVLKTDKDGKEYYEVGYDITTKTESGVLARDSKSSTSGEFISDKAKTYEEAMNELGDLPIEEWARRNGYKVVDNGIVKIASNDTRVKMGRVEKLSEIIGETEAQIMRREADKLVSNFVAKHKDSFDGVISSTKKDGFTELTKEELKRLPEDLRPIVKYVNKDFYEQIMGRQQWRFVDFSESKLGTNDYGRLLDKMATSFVSMFKHKNVVTNTSSYKNGIFVNIFNGLVQGIGPSKQYKFAKQGIKDMNEYNELRMKYSELSLENKIDTKEGKALIEKIKNNNVSKLLTAGLSINTLDGTTSKSNLLAYMMSDLTGGKADKLGNEFFMNSGSKIGGFAQNVFSSIDFSGRYASVMHKLEKGIPLEDAIRDTNNLYGQLDDMTPVVIDVLDRYGLGIFANWASSVLPATTKMVVENPERAIAVTVSAMVIADYFDTTFATSNPVESTLDFAEGTATGDGYIWDKGFRTFMIPGVYRDLYGEAEYRLSDKPEIFRSPLLWQREPAPWIDKDGEVVDYRGISKKIYDTAKENLGD
jgi:hypothetical protein